jgi:hypothetical protein
MSVVTRIEIQLGKANRSDLKVDLDNNKIMLPYGSPLITPEIRSVADLYRVYGDEHMKIRYYAFAQGSVPEHGGGQNYEFKSYLQFLSGCRDSGSSNCISGRSDIIVLASTVPLSKKGDNLPNPAPIIEYTKPKTGLPVFVDCWNHKLSGPDIFHSSMESNGGWQNVSVTVIYEITTNMLSYCSIGRNLTTNQGCYNYFSNTISSGKGTEQMSRVMQDYCSRNLAGKSLADFLPGSTLDPKDQAVCACNMPSSMYSTMRSSVTGLDPRVATLPTADMCLFGPCASSQFKPISSKGCPLPNCLQIININNSNFVGEVNIDQSAECATYFPPVTVPSTPESTPNSSTTPDKKEEKEEKEEKTFFQKYGWIFVVVLIVLMIGGIIILILSRKPKSYQYPRLPPVKSFQY